MGGQWTVGIVDDHPVVRLGLRAVLERDERFVIGGEAGGLAAARELMMARQPDFLVLDLMLGGRDDLEFLRELKGLHSRGRILVFSAQPELVYAPRAFVAGADGYLMKDSGVEHVPEILAAMATGERFASAAVQRAMFQKIAGGSLALGPEEISDRELQVLRLLGAGRGTAEIAQQLCLSAKTIGTYRERLKDKLGVAGARELERMAEEYVRTGRLDNMGK